MRNEGRLVLGFYPLPEAEAKRLKRYLEFPDRDFAAVDPCVGDGTAFAALLDGTTCHRYGIELDGLRAESAKTRQIDVLHADALEVHCPPECVSLLYLNPPYDFEVGSFRNRRFEELFLRHTLRWLKATGVLAFVIPQRRLIHCSALLAEHFSAIRVYRLRSAECVQYHQIAVVASRRAARQSQNDRQYRTAVNHLNDLANEDANIPNLGDVAEVSYRVPPSDCHNAHQSRHSAGRCGGSVAWIGGLQTNDSFAVTSTVRPERQAHHTASWRPCGAARGFWCAQWRFRSGR